MAKTNKTFRPGCLQICCASTVIFLIIVAAVVAVLWFTVFKPKNPDIVLENIRIKFLGEQGTMAVDMVVAIKNPNYGSFKYDNTTSFLHYRGNVIAEFPIQQKLVPARGTLNFSTTGNIMVEKLLTDPNFWNDLFSGSLNFTSKATFDGKICVVKIIKFHGMAFSTCDIFYLHPSRIIKSMCTTKIKL